MLLSLLLLLAIGTQQAPKLIAVEKIADPAEPTLTQNPAQWFSVDAYPPEAIRTGVEGRVGFTLTVDATGHPIACAIDTSSGSALLDDPTCEIAMQHAVFTPGHDKTGKAIAGKWHSVVRWILPQGNTHDFASGPIANGSTVEITLDDQGKSVKCGVVSTIGEVGDPCANFQSGLPMGPALSNYGKPVGGKLTVTISGRIEPIAEGK